MKFIFAVVVVLLSAPSFAADILENCFGQRAQFFASKLASISEDKATPVLLLNQKREVVGVMSVTPAAKNVTVNFLELCTIKLETDDFYYADDDAGNLLKWTTTKSTLEITQDEGSILLKATVAERNEYASLIKVDFKAYDVFLEEEEVAAGEGKPDHREEWGLPRGKGTFYFYLPAEWTK